VAAAEGGSVRCQRRDDEPELRFAGGAGVAREDAETAGEAEDFRAPVASVRCGVAGPCPTPRDIWMNVAAFATLSSAQISTSLG
jgi:hypothetical protein